MKGKKKETISEESIDLCKTCPLHINKVVNYCKYVSHPSRNTWQKDFTLQNWCKDHPGQRPWESMVIMKKMVIATRNSQLLSKETVNVLFEKYVRKTSVKINGNKYTFNFGKALDVKDDELICESRCPLNNYCCDIKNPNEINDEKETFMDFCLKGGKKISEEKALFDDSLDSLLPVDRDVLDFARDFSPEVYKKYIEDREKESEEMTIKN